jgi:hypothetical protein
MMGLRLYPFFHKLLLLTTPRTNLGRAEYNCVSSVLFGDVPHGKNANASYRAFKGQRGPRN